MDHCAHLVDFYKSQNKDWNEIKFAVWHYSALSGELK